MTGVLPIAKYSDGSELNMFLEYNMATRVRFSEMKIRHKSCCWRLVPDFYNIIWNNITISGIVIIENRVVTTLIALAYRESFP